MWVSLVVSLLVAACALAAYHGLARRELATVDLAEIVRIKQMQFTEFLSRPEASDADRAAALDLVARLGPSIDAAVERLQQECGCAILVKGAVVGGVTRDLTERLKEKLDLAGLSSRQLEAGLQDRMSARAAPVNKAPR
jgi:Type-F conjugative transfer system protein (TrbI_Ftype)